jgi:spore germination protein
MEGFNERIDANINLITQYYHQPNILIKNFSVGTVKKNRVTIIYDKTLIDKEFLDNLTKELNSIKAPVIQALTELQRYLFKRQVLIPRLLATQRPDRCIRALTQGRTIIFLEGTPVGLIAPAAFHEFMSTVDDKYLLAIPALFLILLRYFALLLSTTLPAWYVAITSYNPEILRVQLALSISSSRSGVPYPSFVEVVIMLILMEFLIEASIRLPKSIGQAATTVGGLILGQAATQAHLVSNIMIIVVATVAISNFLIPIVSMNLTLRVMKYLFLFLACFTGIMGIMLGVMVSTCYLFSMYSFNMPFIDPVGNFSIKKIAQFFRKEI